MMSKEIWAFTEYTKEGLTRAAPGLLWEARRLARALNGKTCACILGSGLGGCFSLLGNSGAEKIYFSDDERYSECSLDACAPVLHGLVMEYRPRVIIFDASSWGSELAARISWRLRLPCITEVKRIDVEGEKLVVSKSCYEGKVYQNTTIHPGRTAVLTFLPGDTGNPENYASGQIEMAEVKPGCGMERTRTRCIKFLKGDPGEIGLEDSDMIVAGGKGIGKEASALEELAGLLGASVGGTRPLVDEGVLPFERQIGITGKSVSPRLLFALGVSGAREFTAGTEKARLTIAVNRDENAPIFKAADLKVHGDLKDVIPALAKRLRQYKESNK